MEFEGTDRVLDLLATYQLNACFAVVGAAALPGSRPYSDQAQIRRMHLLGHEVASHSFRHEWLPGLNRVALLETLRTSKDALEQCIGAEVVSFVPPFNQPFDYVGGGAISLAERLHRDPARIGIRELCTALAATGYRFCRISYQPLYLRVAEVLLRRRIDRPQPLQNISGVLCAKLNTPGGFARQAIAMIDRCSRRGGAVVVYGHPHSLYRRGAQHVDQLVVLLERAAALRAQGQLTVCLPRDLLAVQ